jgi:hypothetical protein
MRKLLLFTLLTVVLAGCSSGTTPSRQDPRPESTATLPDTMKTIGPIMLTETDTEATVVAGIDTVVFDLAEPSSWTAKIAPSDLASFQPGSDDSTMISNPALYPLQAGVITVELTNGAGRTLTYTITITAPVLDESITSVDEPALATEAFGFTILGLSEADAIAAIEASGRVARISERDGEGFALTRDYRPNRLNLVVTSGIVSRFDVG